MSIAAKSSDLAEEMPGASLQVDGQMEEPTQSAKDLWESEEDDSPLPTCHCGCQSGGHHLATPISNIV